MIHLVVMLFFVVFTMIGLIAVVWTLVVMGGNDLDVAVICFGIDTGDVDWMFRSTLLFFGESYYRVYINILKIV